MLVIDSGNSRIKWARCEQGRLTVRAAGAQADLASFAALERALTPDVDRVVVANVAGESVAQKIGELVESSLGIAPEFVRVARSAYGIECAYREPASLGVDRWLAMIAARRHARGAFVVVGAGTAVTCDAVADDGRHLGGLILPGERLMIESLATGTEQIDVVPRAGAPAPGLGLLGRSTADAVARGSRFALAAAIDRCVRLVADALMTEPELYLTGGDARPLAEWLESKPTVSADLVLEGICLIAAEPE